MKKRFKLIKGQKKKKKLWYVKYLGQHREKRYKFIFFKIGHDFAITDIVVFGFQIFNDDPLRFLLKVFFAMFLSYIFGISFHIFAPTRENAFFCVLSLDFFNVEVLWTWWACKLVIWIWCPRKQVQNNYRCISFVYVVHNVWDGFTIQDI